MVLMPDDVHSVINLSLGDYKYFDIKVHLYAVLVPFQPFTKA